MGEIKHEHKIFFERQDGVYGSAKGEHLAKSRLFFEGDFFLGCILNMQN